MLFAHVGRSLRLAVGNANCRKEKDNMKRPNTKIILVLILILIVSPIITYLIAFICKNFHFIPPVGSVDAWIGFSGSIIGGGIAIIVLYFTVKQEHEIIEKQTELSIRPYIYCKLKNETIENSANDKEIVLKKTSYNDEFIEWAMINSSNNIANNIQIKCEQYYIELKDQSYKQVDSLEHYGISLYTILHTNAIFIPPYGEQLWKTNFIVDKDVMFNKDGAFKWGGSSFVFKHAITYCFSNILNNVKYTGKFEYAININVGREKKLYFYLHSLSNSMLDT